MWQFRPATAREYGLVITSNRDDRLDPVASTRAAAEYLRDLLAVFGHNSISLVAAAYNAGDSRVRFALRQIEDPGTQRNFWYLSGRRLVPLETREYVVKVLAAVVLAARWDVSTDGLR
jgi:membrane-bound lytic murein transglycosylase D